MPNDVTPINEPNRIEGVDLSETCKAVGTILKSIADDFADQWIDDSEQIESMGAIEIAMEHSDEGLESHNVANPEASLRSVLENPPYEDLAMDYALDRQTVGEFPLNWERVRIRIEDYLNHSMNACAGGHWEAINIDKNYSEIVVSEVVPPYPAVAKLNDGYACWLPDIEMLAGGEVDFYSGDTIEGVYLP